MAPKEELAEVKANEVAGVMAVGHTPALDEDGLPDYVDRNDMHISEGPKPMEQEEKANEAKQAPTLESSPTIAMDENDGPNAEAKRAADGAAGSSASPTDAMQDSVRVAGEEGVGSDPKKFRGERDGDVSDASKVDVSG